MFSFTPDTVFGTTFLATFIVGWISAQVVFLSTLLWMTRKGLQAWLPSVILSICLVLCAILCFWSRPCWLPLLLFTPAILGSSFLFNYANLLALLRKEISKVEKRWEEKMEKEEKMRKPKIGWNELKINPCCGVLFRVDKDEEK